MGVLLNLIIGGFAMQRRSLTYPSGFFAAAVVGFTIYLASPLGWLSLMIFFVSSTILTKFKSSDPHKTEVYTFAAKGGERDGFQVFANGGSSFIFAIFLIISKGLFSYSFTSALLLALITSIAASTADTWSTEIGSLSKSEPVSILNPRKKVLRGESGGVTILGFFGAFLGSSIIALSYLLITFNWTQAFYIVSFGFLGSIIDSILGIIAQVQYYCPTCEKYTEQSPHSRCGTILKASKGIPFVNNDVVNFLASFLSGLMVYILILLL